MGLTFIRSAPPDQDLQDARNLLAGCEHELPPNACAKVRAAQALITDAENLLADGGEL